MTRCSSTFSELPGVTPVPKRGLLGLYHFAILLPDRASLGRFLRHVTALGVHVGMADHLVSEALYLTDPDGLGIEVYADRARASWKKTDRQIAMASDPLDVQVSSRPGVTRRSPAFRWNRDRTCTSARRRHRAQLRTSITRAWLRQNGLELSRRAFSRGGRISSPSWDQHLGRRRALGQRWRRALIEWEVQLPTTEDTDAALGTSESAGHKSLAIRAAAAVSDPWGTRVRLRVDTVCRGFSRKNHDSPRIKLGNCPPESQFPQGF